MLLSAIDHALLAGTVALGLAFAASQARAFDAVVTTCHDGDTCTVTASDGHRLHIRLHAIDAPELDQPSGTEAQALISELVVGHQVDIRPTGGYSHNRMVADMNVDGTDVAAFMVSRGYAWVAPRWNTDPEAPNRQASAQRAHLGLWADTSAMPPWQWRAEHGTGSAYPPSGWPEHFRWTHSGPGWSKAR